MTHLNQSISHFPTYWPEPDFSLAAFIAPTATVVGWVKMGTGSSIWYGAVVRGDVEKITIGDRTNVQDGAILHGDPGQVTRLEECVTVGHRAVIHAATIERGSLIGIGAVIMDGVRIGAGSIIGAGAIVTKNVEPRSLMVGIPAKRVRTVTETEAIDLIEHAHRYEKLALVHANKGTDPGFPQPKSW